MLHPTELPCILFFCYVAPSELYTRPSELYTRPSELRCTPLSCAAFYWATLNPYGAIPHPTELYHTLVSYTAPYWAMFRPDELPHLHSAHCNLLGYCILLSYPTCTQHPTELCWIFWAMLCLIEPRGALLSYAAPYWAMLHLLSYTSPYWAMLHPAELCCTPYGLAHPNWATLHPIELRMYPNLNCAVLYWAIQHPVSYAAL